jgi:hypothetical protein
MRLVSDSADDAMDAGSPAKIALFSLGNLASHPECAARLAALGIADVLAGLATVQDAVVTKYCARIRVRLLRGSTHFSDGHRRPLRQEAARLADVPANEQLYRRRQRSIGQLRCSCCSSVRTVWHMVTR